MTRRSGPIPERPRSQRHGCFGFGIIDIVALQQKREDRAGGGYSLIAWDDELGHAVIWEYDLNDQLQRRGVITHVDGGAPARDGSSETIWHDATGREIKPS